MNNPTDLKREAEEAVMKTIEQEGLGVRLPRLVTLSADYDEFKPETLRGFVVEFDGVETRFDDAAEALNFAERQSSWVAARSSFDDYFMDSKTPNPRFAA